MAKFCTNCGKEVGENAYVCVNCGAKVNGVTNPANTNPDAKSKLVAGLLGIFLGAFGVHNFYLGNTGKAVAQLLISVLSCFTLAIVSEIWGLIEGILILAGNIKTDGHGNDLRD